jgi:single-stranded-DNA-specific exonuclease
MQMTKRWLVENVDEIEVENLQKQLHIHPSLCKILINRGIDTFEKAKSFFRPQLSQLHDPFLMNDMNKAIDRLLIAIEKNEKILVFGDYDVDGTTAVALVYNYLKSIYSDVDYYIPDRYKEGYGISTQSIDFAMFE